MSHQHYQADLTIDLHGVRVEDAELQVIRVLRALQNRGKSVAIIHGYGTGAVKNAVRALVRRTPEVREVWLGEDYNLPGLGGVTVVFLES